MIFAGISGSAVADTAGVSGMCIYVACDLMDVKVGDVFPTMIPFLLATFVCIALMIAFPQLITLPTALMRV